MEGGPDPLSPSGSVHVVTLDLCVWTGAGINDTLAIIMIPLVPLSRCYMKTISLVHDNHCKYFRSVLL